MIHVMIVEDQELIRQSLELVLSNRPGICVISTAADGLEAIELCRSQKPNVILMDIRMPKLDGVEACRIIKEKYPEIKIIVLTTFEDDEYVFNAIRFGSSGYLLKGISVDALVSAIQTVNSGGTLINPAIASKLVSFFSHMANQPQLETSVKNDDLSELTTAENKIANLISKGLSNKEIAIQLYLSEGTVRNSISTILAKLNLRDRTQIAIYYINKDFYKQRFKHGKF